MERPVEGHIAPVGTAASGSDAPPKPVTENEAPESDTEGQATPSAGWMQQWGPDQIWTWQEKDPDVGTMLGWVKENRAKPTKEELLEYRS